MAGDSRVTLAVIGSKLDTLTQVLGSHIASDEEFQAEMREAMNGCDEYPGLRGRLDRVERTQKFQKWIGGSFLLGGIATFWTWLKGN